MRRVFSVLARILSLLASILGVLCFLALLAGTTVTFPLAWHVRTIGLHFDDVLAYAEARSDWTHVFLPERKLQLSPFAQRDQQNDLRKLSQLFPDEASRKVVLDWGWQVFESWRGPRLAYMRKYPSRDSYFLECERIVQLQRSEALAAHAAWQRLILAPGADEADLLQMRQVVEQTVPDPEQRTVLLEWADQRRTQRHVKSEETPRYYLAAEVPELEWFRYWILYDDWCVKPAMFEAKKEALLARLGSPNRLGRSVWQAVQDWGGELSRKRRDLRPLPDGERRNVLAVLDRLTGMDPAFARFEEALGQMYPDLDRDTQRQVENPVRQFSFVMALTASPVDDLMYFAFSGKFVIRYHDRLTIEQGGTGLTLVLNLLTYLVSALLMYRGMRLVTLVGPARLLGLADQKAYQAYHESIRRSFRLVILFFLVLPPLTFLAWLQLEPRFVLYMRGWTDLLAGVASAALFTGILTGSLANLVTLGFLRAGKDPRKLWVDECLAAVLGVSLLWFFSNSWPSIVAGTLLGTMPGLLHKLSPNRAGKQQRVSSGKVAPRRAGEIE